MGRISNLLLAAALISIQTNIGHCDERLWLDAKINDKSVRLCFDSGSSDFVLYQRSLERLGLRLVEPGRRFTNVSRAPGEVPAGTTEACKLYLEGATGITQFRVLDVPKYVGMEGDGLVSWRVIRDNIIQIDAESHRVSFLQKLPKKVVSWNQLRISTNYGCLVIETPRPGSGLGLLCVDTGSDEGISLSADRWREWTATHPGQNKTLKAYFTPTSGIVVREETWADKVSVGGLSLKEVPIMEASRDELPVDPIQYEATLGLTGLKRLNFIVDGKNAIAYAEARSPRVRPYSHNRLGAAFIPTEAGGEKLVARVANGGPAERAGIQNGDVLLRLDGAEVTRSRPESLSKFFMPPGAKLTLVIQRAEETFETNITLKDILGPTIKRNNRNPEE